jgi:hypothetical protein
MALVLALVLGSQLVFAQSRQDKPVYGSDISDVFIPDTLEQDTAYGDTMIVRERGKVIKKDIEPKDQVRIGVTIMTFVIIVMVLANNYNPD